MLGSRHARYLQQMRELFERGNLHDALRHAIPLGGQAEQALRLALAPPKPRTALRISAHATQATTTIPLSPDRLSLLREHYRRAARQLIERGQIEEAAFVHAELLGDAEAAVALLERHGQLRQAAELAEGRVLAPRLVVRQWLLASPFKHYVQPGRSHVVRLVVAAEGGTETLKLFTSARIIPLLLFHANAAQTELHATAPSAAVVHSAAGTARVAVVDLDTGQIVLRVTLEGSARVRLRFNGGTLAIADDGGRLQLVALAGGRVLRDARLSA